MITSGTASCVTPLIVGLKYHLFSTLKVFRTTLIIVKIAGKDMSWIWTFSCTSRALQRIITWAGHEGQPTLTVLCRSLLKAAVSMASTHVNCWGMDQSVFWWRGGESFQSAVVVSPHMAPWSSWIEPSLSDSDPWRRPCDRVVTGLEKDLGPEILKNARLLINLNLIHYANSSLHLRASESLV